MIIFDKIIGTNVSSVFGLFWQHHRIQAQKNEMEIYEKTSLYNCKKRFFVHKRLFSNLFLSDLESD